MGNDAVAEPWMGYAATGRPDFLNYLRRGDVTWDRLWDYYRGGVADPGAMLRLIGLFHIFHSQDFDGEGCTLAEGSIVASGLHNWAEFVLDCADFLPEENLRENLASLLGQSLVSALYYEAVFNVYLQATLKRLVAGVEPPAVAGEEWELERRQQRRLRLLLDGGHRVPAPASEWRRALDRIIERNHACWEREFVLALGEEHEGWLDEGGEG